MKETKSKKEFKKKATKKEIKKVRTNNMIELLIGLILSSLPSPMPHKNGVTLYVNLPIACANHEQLLFPIHDNMDNICSY